jgi:hypothetical protein
MWNAVIVSVDFDVVIDIDPTFAEGRNLVALCRQRTKHRPVESFEPFAPVTFKLLKWAQVQINDELADGLVEFGEAEEAMVAQMRQNPTLDDLHADLDLRLLVSQQLSVMRNNAQSKARPSRLPTRFTRFAEIASFWSAGG